jgi:hypothetical protein
VRRSDLRRTHKIGLSGSAPGCGQNGVRQVFGHDARRLDRLIAVGAGEAFGQRAAGRFGAANSWRRIIHRTGRRDLSLFQRGLDMLDYFEIEGGRIPVELKPYRAPSPIKSIRRAIHVTNSGTGQELHLCHGASPAVKRSARQDSS